ALKKNAPFIKANPKGISETAFSLKGTSFKYGKTKYNIRLLSACQPENAICAIEALNVLKSYFNIEKKDILKGLKDAYWPVRFEIVRDKPLLILDGAHNEAASLKLKESLELYFKDKTLVFIMGMLSDKDVESVVSNTVKYADNIICITPPNNKRALDKLELARIVTEKGGRATTADSLSEALWMAGMLAGENPVIAFGSLSYMGELKRLIEKDNKNDNRKQRV
ncbi:MAG: bifunctional folylpolyglutamate synthase/dihydrofolate synthase, partial [Lachnospiraceae bacterium]|nr:bifunctional folylpolyglutamate synthase/dihydrofolate synthase [Lachnospiraceae bacterium]